MKLGESKPGSSLADEADGSDLFGGEHLKVQQQPTQVAVPFCQPTCCFEHQSIIDPSPSGASHKIPLYVGGDMRPVGDAGASGFGRQRPVRSGGTGDRMLMGPAGDWSSALRFFDDGGWRVGL